MGKDTRYSIKQIVYTDRRSGGRRVKKSNYITLQRLQATEYSRCVTGLMTPAPVTCAPIHYRPL